MTKPTLLFTCLLTTWIAVRADDFTPTPTEAKIVELTNLERKKKELPPLLTNALLFKVAQAHSENMAKQGKMEHVLDGKKPGDRMREAGYKFARAHENIAKGDPQVPLEDLMKAWMESKGHRENILTEMCTEIGIGIAKDADGQVYYTQVFGKRR